MDDDPETTRVPNGDEAMKNLDKLTDKLFSVREADDETVVEETETTEIVEED
jgi:hypothetical protein